MRKIFFAVLLTCCLMVLSVTETTRVCADDYMWFWYSPNIHDPKIDNDGDGYYESANLCIGVRSSVSTTFSAVVHGRDGDGVEHDIYTSYGSCEFVEADNAYEYAGHTKLVVPFHDTWDFKVEIYGGFGGAHDARNYGDEPTLTDVKMEGELMALVVRGEDNRIYYRIYDQASPGTWGAWNAVPTGATIDSPAASLPRDGRLQIVVRGMDGLSLWHCSINLADNSFSGWDRVAGATNSKPTLCKDTLYVRGLDNRVYYSPFDYYHNTFGYTWNVVPSGSTCDSPAASYLCTVVRGMDGNSLWYGNRTFDGWKLLDGTTHAAPTLMDWVYPGWLTTAATSYYEFVPSWSYLIVLGLDDSIYYKQHADYDGQYSWGSWGTWPTGATCDSPGAATIDYDFHLVVRGMDEHSLWHAWLDCETFEYHGWYLLSGSTPSAPTLAS